MRRRSFLASLAAFFGFGAAAEADDGSQYGVGHALADAIGNGLETPLIVPKGTLFRCENGHIRCEAIATIRYGDVNWHEKIGRWYQRKPEVGEDFPRCTRCGTKIVFWRNKRGINAL